MSVTRWYALDESAQQRLVKAWNEGLAPRAIQERFGIKASDIATTMSFIRKRYPELGVQYRARRGLLSDSKSAVTRAAKHAAALASPDNTRYGTASQLHVKVERGEDRRRHVAVGTLTLPGRINRSPSARIAASIRRAVSMPAQADITVTDHRGQPVATVKGETRDRIVAPPTRAPLSADAFAQVMARYRVQEPGA